MAKDRNVELSRDVWGILNDPVYKEYYVFKIKKTRGDVVLSPVMDHENYLIFEAGLRSKTINGEIKDFDLIGRGSEEDMSDLLYIEQDALTKSFK